MRHPQQPQATPTLPAVRAVLGAIVTAVLAVTVLAATVLAVTVLAVMVDAPAVGAEPVAGGASGTAGAASAEPPLRYTPVTLRRLADTRRTGGPLAAWEARPVPVDAADGSRVLVNLTTFDTAAEGYLYTQDPSVSLSNPFPGRIVARSALLTVTGGQVTVTSTVVTGLAVDLLGVFSPVEGAPTAGRFETVTPVRLLDSRDDPVHPRPAWHTYEIAVPAGDTGQTAAAVVNVTVTGGSGAGFVSADGGRTSVLNSSFAADTTTNFSVLPLRDGRLTLTVNNDADLIVDLLGTVTGGRSPAGRSGLLVTSRPARMLDTRDTATPAPGERVPFPLNAPAGYGALIGVTATDSATDGFVAVAGRESPLGGFSNLNPRPGIGAVGNLAVLSSVGGARALTAAQTDVVIDVFAYLTGDDPGFRVGYPSPGERSAAFACRPLRYRVNVADAPAGTRDEVRRAFTAISEASGWQFDDAGDDSSFFPYAADADLKVTVAPRVLFDGFVPDGAGGYGGGYAYGGTRPRIGAGFAMVVAETGDFRSLHAALLHEIGHAMGLGHVDDERQVMYPLLGRADELGVGDRRGLRVLHETACEHG